jgi:hypothetical protein
LGAPGPEVFFDERATTDVCSEVRYVERVRFDWDPAAFADAAGPLVKSLAQDP